MTISPSPRMRVSKLPASQQLVGTVTPAFDQPRTPALPLQSVCHLLGFGHQLHPTGLHQPALTLSHCTLICSGNTKVYRIVAAAARSAPQVPTADVKAAVFQYLIHNLTKVRAANTAPMPLKTRPVSSPLRTPAPPYSSATSSLKSTMAGSPLPARTGQRTPCRVTTPASCRAYPSAPPKPPASGAASVLWRSRTKRLLSRLK